MSDIKRRDGKTGPLFLLSVTNPELATIDIPALLFAAIAGSFLVGLALVRQRFDRGEHMVERFLLFLVVGLGAGRSPA